MDLEKIGRIFEEDLKFINEKENLYLNPDVIRYISFTILKYINNLPYYLVDVQEKTTFRTYKTKGDVSLLLVGLFTEWLNRLNRPVKEEDYIKTGKLNYESAYLYLDINYGKELKEEIGKSYLKYLKNEDYSTYLDIFREMSELFEDYTLLLKQYRKEQQQFAEFLNKIPAAKFTEFQILINKIYSTD